MWTQRPAEVGGGELMGSSSSGPGAGAGAAESEQEPVSAMVRRSPMRAIALSPGQTVLARENWRCPIMLLDVMSMPKRSTMRLATRPAAQIMASGGTRGPLRPRQSRPLSKQPIRLMPTVPVLLYFTLAPRSSMGRPSSTVPSRPTRKW